MSRYIYETPRILPTTYMDKAEGRQQVLQIRDELRAILDPSGTGDNWLVTDTSEWSGGSSDGIGFIVEHRDGNGTKTGHEWWFCWPISNNTTDGYRHELRDFLDGSQVSNEYRSDSGGRTSNNSDAAPIVLHYNHNGGNDGYDHHRTDDGTNEGASPNSSPYGSFSSFYPSHTTLRGAALHHNRFSEKYRHAYVLLADDAAPFFQLVPVSPYWRVPHIYLAGNIVTPYDTNVDTDETGALHMVLRDSGRGDDSMINDNTLLEGFNHSSGREIFNVGWSKDLTRDNAKRSDGTYVWRPLSVSNSNLFKGHLKTDLVREMGANNTHPYKLFSGPSGPLIHYHESICCPWVTGEAPFPPGTRLDDTVHPNRGV